MDEASAQLRRHLKFRKFYDLDHADQIEEHEILRKYFPIGLVGETGRDNTLLVIECAGRIDLVGILKSVQLSDFLIQRFRLQEKMLAAMNALESRTGKQASVVYILDLDGLKFDPSLLSIVTGPYRILWASVYTNYPEWIAQMYIVNAPSFMSLIWKALSPLLPERTRNKVRICTANSDWKDLIQKASPASSLTSHILRLSSLFQHARPENIPAHWGGKLYDSNGDGMCRDRLNIPFDPIPKDLYWTPDEKSPGLSDLTTVSIPAGKAKIVTYVLSTHEPTYIVVNSFNRRGSDWFPDFDYPGMPTVDYLRIRTLGAGVYKVKFGNEEAWVRALSVFYRIRFENENGELVDFKELQ
ncbi:unnamed protein product [Heligmosomoides polygyrus]|uniref:CRAL-TRIO domain-containing protein n=1 Tax=Heligmosomoides polygyrus TaxID=6339 RepID=A0A3P8BL79_HELPZ|nr:unnamed protein product [Heligmosomoides polygyrus]